jgi:hypothetical protein
LSGGSLLAQTNVESRDCYTKYVFEKCFSVVKFILVISKQHGGRDILIKIQVWTNMINESLELELRKLTCAEAINISTYQARNTVCKTTITITTMMPTFDVTTDKYNIVKICLLSPSVNSKHQ